MSMIENNDIILKCILKQIQIPRNLLLLFESARETPVKRLKTIARQRKLPKSLQFKPGCYVEFCQNFIVDIIEFQVLKRNSIFEKFWFINNDQNLFAIDLITASK